MTLYGFAWGLTVVVAVAAAWLAIQALWLVRRTRRLRREVEAQRARFAAELARLPATWIGTMARACLRLECSERAEAGSLYCEEHHAA